MPEKPFQLVMKIVLENSEGKILMIKRSMKSKIAAGKWEFPGGKVDPGENFIEGLVREVQEETNLSIIVDNTLDAFQAEAPTSIFVYLLMHGITKSGTLHLSDEHMDAIWITREKLGDLDVSPVYAPFCKKYCSNPLY